MILECKMVALVEFLLLYWWWG